MLELLIAFLITFGFVADKAEYQELPPETKIEYQQIYEASLIGTDDIFF